MMDMVVRDAKIFEAANYPDRGFKITEADLDSIVASFKADGKQLDVKVEHINTAFDGKMGKVVEVWRVGRDLMAKLSFHQVVWDFLEHMGSKKLSVGLEKCRLRLKEVSIVEQPRVLTAQLFGDSLAEVDGLLVFSTLFGSGSESKGGVRIMSGEVDISILLQREREAGKAEGLAAAEVQFLARVGPVEAENATLKRKNAEDAAYAKINSLKAEGKLAPASEKFALGILVDGQAEVTFSDGGHMSAADAFIQFMAFQPPVIQTLSGVSKAAKDSVYDDADKAIFSELGVTEDEVRALEV